MSDGYIENIEGPVFPGLRAPCNTMVAGVSSSGKTTLVHKVLKHKDVMYTRPVNKVMYCMTVDQPLYKEMRKDVPGLTFHRGIPTEQDLDAFTDGSQHCLVVLDDLMEQVVRSVEAQNLVTKYSHHKQISVIFITQNIFANGKCARNVSVNCHYFLLLCNPRDVRQINILADQTGLGSVLKESYKDSVMARRYGYQLLSLHPAVLSGAVEGSPRLRSRIHTNIFPGEDLVSYL